MLKGRFTCSKDIYCTFLKTHLKDACGDEEPMAFMSFYVILNTLQ